MFNNIQEDEPQSETEKDDDIVIIEQIDGIRPECGAGTEVFCEPQSLLV